MATIYHIRHGETDWNVDGRLQGWRDLPMNARGLQQAADAAHILHELFAREGKSPADFAYVSSPLIRATATMRIVRTELKLPVEDFPCDDRLREIGYGTWEGQTLREMAERDPVVFARRSADKWETAPPSGESYAHLAARVRAWYATLTEDTVVTAHGGTTRVLMVITGGATTEEAADRPIKQGAVYVFGQGEFTTYS
jgi:broad specificity phosphatase PhoE